MPEGAKTIFTTLLVGAAVALFFFVKKHDFKPQMQALQQSVNNTLEKMKPVDPDKAELYRRKKPLPSGAVAAAAAAVTAAAPEAAAQIADAASAAAGMVASPPPVPSPASPPAPSEAAAAAPAQAAAAPDTATAPVPAPGSVGEAIRKDVERRQAHDQKLDDSLKQQ